ICPTSIRSAPPNHPREVPNMADSYPARSGGDRALRFLGGLALVVACLYWARTILVPLTLAVLLTFILSPLVIRLQRRGVKRGIAVFLVVAASFALLGGLCWGITAQLRNLLVEIPQHRNEIATKVQQLKGTGMGPAARLIEMVNDITVRLEGE